MLENTTVKQISVGVEASDWEDAIRKSSQCLLDENKIEARYIDAMIEAVKRIGPYIVLGNHVALAHARPECGVKELSVHFTTLQPPIPFGSDKFDPVHLIITLAAIDADSHIELLSELAGILMDEDNVNALVACQSAQEFLQLLQELKED